MKAPVTLAVAFALITSAVAQINGDKFDPKRDASADIKQAITLAAKESKHVLVDVGGEWCGWCHRLDKLFKEDATVAGLLRDHYVIVKVNFSEENENKEALSQFPPITTGYPHLFVLDGKGKLLQDQDTGLLEEGDHHSPAKVVAFLKEFRPKSVPAVLAKPVQAAPAALPEWNPVAVGAVAPDFVVTTPAGKELKLSDLRGKTVILDFWATWCGPCMASMPGLEKIYQQIKDQDVVVLSVNTWDEKDAYAKWVKEKSGTTYNFTFVRDPAEGDRDAIRKGSIAKRLYNVIGIPTMYIIDAKGNVAGSLLGSGNEEGLIKILGGLGVKATVPN